MEQLESKLVSVKVYDKELCWYIRYREERKILFGLFGIIEAGFYEDPGDNFLGNKKDFLRNHDYVLDEDNNVYYRPHVKLQFESGRNAYTYFSTIELCRDYVMRIHCKYPDLIDVDDFLEI